MKRSSSFATMWSLLSARMALTKPAASEMEGSSSTVVALGDGLHDESKFSEQEFSDHAIKSSRQKKTVTLFQAIPLDVLFEIFSHLTPEDIIHLSQTNRIFHNTLMMESATFVWKAARERFGAPECPLNMSEPQWCVLLFGNLCQNCGAKNIPNPDFSLLRRVCMNCKEKNLLEEYIIEAWFPHIAHEVLELLPYTTVSAEAHWQAGSRFFWISDFHTVIQKLAKLEHNIYLCHPGAQQALEDFKAQQIDLVTSIRQSKNKREQWFYELSQDRWLESVQSKFIELGYAASDVARLRSSLEREHLQPFLLTDQIWECIRPSLERKVLRYKQERLECLEREKIKICSARRAIIHISYQEYKKTLMPSQWKYLPRTLDICALDPFAKVVDFAVDITVIAADFEDAFRQLPELLTGRSSARKLHARSLIKIPTLYLLPASGTPEPEEILDGEAAMSSDSLHPDVLDLATATFTCQGWSCSCAVLTLFGWDDIAQHHCALDLDSFANPPTWPKYGTDPGHFPDPPKITFSAVRSRIAGIVVRAAGLDDRVATASDMDAKDLRFGCSVCPPWTANGTAAPWIKAGYKWREFVSHCTSTLHAPEFLIVLPPAIIAIVKASEMTHPNRSWSQWTCGHCTEHLDNLKIREVIIEHLKSAHGIDSPCEPDDLFLFERHSSPSAFEATYPVQPLDAVPTALQYRQR